MPSPTIPCCSLSKLCPLRWEFCIYCVASSWVRNHISTTRPREPRDIGGSTTLWGNTNHSSSVLCHSFKSRARGIDPSIVGAQGNPPPADVLGVSDGDAEVVRLNLVDVAGERDAEFPACRYCICVLAGYVYLFFVCFDKGVGRYVVGL